jgi:hypothetical protein
MKNFFMSIKDFAKKNPARTYGYVVALGAYFAKTVPAFPQDLFMLFIMGALGLGESVQRVEDKKTEEALYTEVPKKTPKK